MSEQHFLGKVALKAILVSDGKVLLTRDSRDSDMWEIPGGRLNEGESIEVALKREVFEELGARILSRGLVYSEQYHQAKDGQLSLLLAYEVALEDSGASFKVDPMEVAEMKWIAKEELDSQKIYKNCLNALKAYWNL